MELYFNHFQRIGSPGLQSLAAALPPGLRRVSLLFLSCSVQAEGAKAVALALVNLQELRELCLDFLNAEASSQDFKALVPKLHALQKHDLKLEGASLLSIEH